MIYISGINRIPFRGLRFTMDGSNVTDSIGSVRYLPSKSLINSFIVRNADDNDYLGTMKGPYSYFFASALDDNDKRIKNLKFIVEQDTSAYFIIDRDIQEVIEVNNITTRWSTSDGGFIETDLAKGKKFEIIQYEDIQDNILIFNYK